ncbi:MAG: sigma-70 family RNA polymerase sigma factor [Clostridia bacterium]|nr:sigma-70 family RNA polymerase sigma factor [Clostridia bacterium]
MDDSRLAERLKMNDETALAEVIGRFTPIVSTVIYNVSGGSLSSEDIEEIASDAFTALWYSRDKIINDKLKGFICRIAKNKARDRLRRLDKGIAVNIDDVVIEDGLKVAEKIESDDINAVLHEAVGNIGEPDREILIRHYYYYQSAAVISDRMNLNTDTVKSKIRRTREKLKKILLERGFTG